MFQGLLLAILAAILPILQQFINDLFAMMPTGASFIDQIPAIAG